MHGELERSVVMLSLTWDTENEHHFSFHQEVVASKITCDFFL